MPTLELNKAGNILPILKWPKDESALHEVSQDVTEFNEELEQLGCDMIATMKASNGIGLSAPQVGKLLNCIAIQLEENNPLFIINPKVISVGEEMFQVNEGCLSIPGFFEDRKRPGRIDLRFQDVKGQTKEYIFQGLYAFCIQHEMDHLEGKLFIDGSSLLKKTMIKSKMKKAAKRK